MALHYDFSKTDTTNWTQDDYDLMNHFIWGSICVDLGSITEKNLAEWLFRMEFYNTVSLHPKKYFGYVVDGKEHDYKLEHLQKCIGLVTNVTTMPRKTWMKRIVDNLAQNIERDVKEQMKEECAVC